MKSTKVLLLASLFTTTLMSKIDFIGLQQSSHSILQAKQLEDTQIIEQIFNRYLNTPFTITLPTTTAIDIKKKSKKEYYRIIETPIGSIRVINKVVLKRPISFEKKL